MGWDVSVIALDRYISNEEFNEFCFRNNALDVSRHLDLPNADLISFDFNAVDCSIATRVYKCRDRNVKELSEVDLGDEELEHLENPVETIIYVVIMGKCYSELDYLNYLIVVDLFMQNWGGVHRDFQEVVHTHKSIKDQIGGYSQHK